MDEKTINEREIPTYLIQIQKQSAMIGEVMTISANMPKDTSAAQLIEEVKKMSAAIDWRVAYMNKEVKHATKGQYSLMDYDIAAATGIPIDQLYEDQDKKVN